MSNPGSKIGNVLSTIADVADTAGKVAEAGEQVSKSGSSFWQRFLTNRERRVDKRRVEKAIRLRGQARELRHKAESANPKRAERLRNRAIMHEYDASVLEELAGVQAPEPAVM